MTPLSVKSSLNLAKLDTTLITRTTRRMVLTEEGKYFFEQAKVILAHLSPYLVLLLLPGSALILPAYAWWLDRRRIKRRDDLPARATERP